MVLDPLEGSMTTKEYLNQYIDACRDIEILELELKETMQEYDSINILMDGMPHGSGLSDRTGNLAAKISDMVMELIQKRNNAIEIKKQVGATIFKVKGVDQVLYMILYYRYIKGWSFERIAVDGNLKRDETDRSMSYRWVCVLHGKALEAVKKILRSL